MPLSPAQEAGRAKCLVTASEVPDLFGVGRLTPYQFWNIKAGKLPRPDLSGEEHIEWGNLLEAPIARGIAWREGWKIRKVHRHLVAPPELWEPEGAITDPEAPPLLGASLDYEASRGRGHAPGWHPLEIKAVGRYAGWQWQDGPPLPVLLQVQAQLACAGAEVGLVGGLRSVTGPADVAVVPRHPETIRQILLRILAFEVELREGRCPAPDFDNTKDVEAVVALHKAVLPGKVIDRRGDETLEALCAWYKVASAEAGAQKKQADSLWAQILEHLGLDADAAQVELRDHYIKTWPVAEREVAYTAKAHRGHGVYPRKEK